jgi:hypothetical protein
MTDVRKYYAETALPPQYHEHHKFPKWNVKPTVLEEPRLMSRAFPGVSKEEHIKNAWALAVRAIEAEEAYHRALDEAIAEHGDLAPGEGAISGIYNRNFPEDVKENLRRLSRHHMFDQASRAHWKAAGKRTDAGRKALVTAEHAYQVGDRVQRERVRTVPSLPPGTSRG